MHVQRSRCNFVRLSAKSSSSPLSSALFLQFLPSSKVSTSLPAKLALHGKLFTRPNVSMCNQPPRLHTTVTDSTWLGAGPTGGEVVCRYKVHVGLAGCYYTPRTPPPQGSGTPARGRGVGELGSAAERALQGNTLCALHQVYVCSRRTWHPGSTLVCPASAHS
jgi:hypothetical protein